MSMINKTLLPQVNIRKVYVNQGNVLINGFLTAESPGSDGSSFWMDEKYFSQYIDVYFVATKEQLADMLTKVLDMSTFILFCKQIYKLRRRA